MRMQLVSTKRTLSYSSLYAVCLELYFVICYSNTEHFVALISTTAAAGAFSLISGLLQKNV